MLEILNIYLFDHYSRYQVANYFVVSYYPQAAEHAKIVAVAAGVGDGWGEEIDIICRFISTTHTSTQIENFESIPSAGPSADRF